MNTIHRLFNTYRITKSNVVDRSSLLVCVCCLSSALLSLSLVFSSLSLSLARSLPFSLPLISLAEKQQPRTSIVQARFLFFRRAIDAI